MFGKLTSEQKEILSKVLGSEVADGGPGSGRKPGSKNGVTTKMKFTDTEKKNIAQKFLTGKDNPKKYHDDWEQDRYHLPEYEPHTPETARKAGTKGVKEKVKWRASKYEGKYGDPSKKNASNNAKLAHKLYHGLDHKTIKDAKVDNGKQHWNNAEIQERRSDTKREIESANEGKNAKKIKKWITTESGTHIPVGKEGIPENEVGKKIFRETKGNKGVVEVKRSKVYRTINGKRIALDKTVVVINDFNLLPDRAMWALKRAIEGLNIEYNKVKEEVGDYKGTELSKRIVQEMRSIVKVNAEKLNTKTMKYKVVPTKYSVVKKGLWLDTKISGQFGDIETEMNTCYKNIEDMKGKQITFAYVEEK